MLSVGATLLLPLEARTQFSLFKIYVPVRPTILEPQHSSLGFCPFWAVSSLSPFK